MVLSLDFWNTLYFHSFTKEYRMSVIQKEVSQFCDFHKINSASVRMDFFSYASKIIKDNWKNNVYTSDEELGKKLSAMFENDISASLAAKLKVEIENLYLNKIKPFNMQPTVDFIKSARSKFDFVILISDTYFISGETVKKILAIDNLIGYFDKFYFSDQQGSQKVFSNPLSETSQTLNIGYSEIVHIGDLLNTDGEICNQVGAKFLHYVPDKNSSDLNANQINSFSEVLSTIESL